METKQWHRNVEGRTFLITTARDALPHDFINEAFANADMFWAKPMTPESMKTMLDNSCTLGVFETTDGTHTPIGMARMVTDYTTLAYLTDVFLAEDYRRLGLGRWLVQCSRDAVMDMPALRWMMLLTGSPKAEAMYQRELGMEVMAGQEGLTVMGARKGHLEGVAAAGTEGAAGPVGA
ncbi:acetyltransferase [Corynespora cassiicola Philippines]|uniref:Acetyltransferase n=1 Tax=Corynespora cassiicola Philippines TaxID=1448308 RepID=A0A2T2PB86_CORCC|nr:acetyltransferase [Corynespora cassiicola Philippines]